MCMKYIKLFEEWDIELNEALPMSLMQDLALFGNSPKDPKEIEKELNASVGDNAEISIEKKPVSEISLENKELESELKRGDSTDSVVIMKVKQPNYAVPHTFIIPEKKSKKPMLSSSGNLSIPTIYVTKDNAIDMNIGGLRRVLTDLSKGDDIDLDRVISAKVSIKHNL